MMATMIHPMTPCAIRFAVRLPRLSLPSGRHKAAHFNEPPSGLISPLRTNRAVEFIKFINMLTVIDVLVSLKLYTIYLTMNITWKWSQLKLESRWRMLSVASDKLSVFRKASWRRIEREQTEPRSLKMMWRWDGIRERQPTKRRGNILFKN